MPQKVGLNLYPNEKVRQPGRGGWGVGGGGTVIGNECTPQDLYSSSGSVACTVQGVEGAFPQGPAPRDITSWCWGQSPENKSND